MNKKQNRVPNNLVKEGITLKRFIEEKRLLKTKVKLLHILLLDQDLKTLEEQHLTIKDFNLEDIYLLEEMHLIVPVASKIMPIEENNLKLRSYLIYLSYLYSIDFLSIYEQDKTFFFSLLSKLQITDHIKRNFNTLISENKGAYFSLYLEELNNPEYRNALREDKLILQRSVNK